MTSQPKQQPAIPEPASIAKGAMLPSKVSGAAHERALIGNIFHLPASFALVGGLLWKTDFRANLSTGVWWAMDELDKANEDINTLSVARKLMSKAEFMAAVRDGGYASDIESLTLLLENEYAAAPNANRIEALSQNQQAIQGQALDMRIVTSGQAAMVRVAGDKTLTPTQKVDALYAALVDLASTIREDSDAHKITAAAAQIYANIGNPKGLPIRTGWLRFDNLFGGDFRKSVTVLVGYQGRGKTSFMLSKVYQEVTRPEPEKIGLFVIEQDSQDVARKFLSQMTGLKPELTGMVPLKPGDDELVKANVLKMDTWSLRICDTERTVTGIIRKVKRWILEGFTPDRVYIDGGWLIYDEDIGDIPQDAQLQRHFGVIVDRLKNEFALPYNIAVWITFQPNRKGDGDINTPITPDKLSHGKGYYENAQRIFTLHQPEEGRDQSQATCMKDRIASGTDKHVVFAYDRDFDQYTEETGIPPWESKRK